MLVSSSYFVVQFVVQYDTEANGDSILKTGVNGIVDFRCSFF